MTSAPTSALSIGMLQHYTMILHNYPTCLHSRVPIMPARQARHIPIRYSMHGSRGHRSVPPTPGRSRRADRRAGRGGEGLDRGGQGQVFRIVRSQCTNGSSSAHCSASRCASERIFPLGARSGSGSIANLRSAVDCADPRHAQDGAPGGEPRRSGSRTHRR